MISILKKVLGVVCVLIGLLALVTPLTPGAWIALIGFELLEITFLLPRRIHEPWQKTKVKLRERFTRWWSQCRGSIGR